MPYVLVRSTFNPALEQPFLDTRTYIDFHHNRDSNLPDLVQAFGGVHNLVGDRSKQQYGCGFSSAHCHTARTDDPPYAVLNQLEGLSYTVVTVNTVKETTMWTLRYTRA